MTKSTGSTTQTHSSGPFGFIGGIVNTVTHVVTDAVHHPLKTVLHIADTFLGISSMAHDFQVLQSGASWQDKLMALGDLGFNAVSDAMLLTGVGDLADIGIKIGADLLEHGGIEAVSHIAEEEGEHVVEDEVEHAAEGCGGLSFSSNTLVTTSVGAKAIGTLKVGQKVWSYNPKTKKMEWEPIQHVWIDHDHDLVDLTIAWTKHTKKGDVHEDETIHTNQKHPFLTVEAGFVPVANLHVGMHLVEGTGQIAIIEDWLVIAGSQTMYNLTIQQDHTYTVGDGQFVVHNCAASGSDWIKKLPKNPQELIDNGWEDVTHPQQKLSSSSTELLDPDTGRRVRFDEGKPGQPGWEGKDHYHVYNPDSTGKADLYLDTDGNPVRRGSQASHIPPLG